MVRFYQRIVVFCFGILLGVLLAIKCKQYVHVNEDIIKVRTKKHIPSYGTWFENEGLKRKTLLWDTLRYKQNNYFIESHFLFNKIKVLCIILVRSSKNAKAANETWAKGCSDIKFIEINLKGNKHMPVKRTKENSSWVLLCTTLKEVTNKYDWILVVNDSTFVILENLRYYVATLNASKTYYLGYAVKFWNTVYNSGEAGYVLSSGSIRAFNKNYHESDCTSNMYWNREDFYLGRHLASLNITPIDTRDSEDLSTFHPYNWFHVFFPGENYYKTSVFPIKCCSKKSITFQAIEGDKMYTYYYLLYTLQIFFDGNTGNQPPVLPISDDQVWRRFLKERNVLSDNVTSDQYYKLWENLVDDPSSFAAHMKVEVHVDYD